MAIDLIHTVDAAARRVVGAARAAGARNDRIIAFDNMPGELQIVIQ